MESTLIAVDTAKLVFEVAEAGDSGKVVRRLRLNRPQFQEYLVTRQKARFVLEACGGAHHWARLMQRSGHEVRLLPVPYVCAYRRRNKTDRADWRCSKRRRTPRFCRFRSRLPSSRRSRACIAVAAPG